MKYLLIIFVLSVSALAQFQNAELAASDGQAGDQLGSCVSVSGDTLAAASGPKTTRGGFVYLFQRPQAGGWAKATQVAKLTASDGSLFDSVSVSGSVVVAGASAAVVNGVEEGAVYLFVEPSGGWHDATETARVTSSDGVSRGAFGASVAINGQTILAGAPNAGPASQGEAYVFVEPPTGWATGTETARLTASNRQTGDAFGYSVAINGYRAAVGAPEAGPSGEGAAYMFQETVGGWVNMNETAELTNAKGSRENFGWSVAELGGTVVVGAPLSGKAYVFVEPASGWVSAGTPTATLTPTQETSDFGYSTAINPHMILIGDPAARTGYRQYNGGAFAYIEPADGWKSATESARLFPRNGATGAAPGWSVSAEMNTKAFLGAPDATVGQNQYQGAVFVMTVEK
jgi:hypothetical protein